MGNTEDAFGKKRDHNQYGEVEKDIKDNKNRKEEELPKMPNKGPEAEDENS